MNKILNINLGGYALTIDDDAYEYLNGYLDSIRKRFSESEGRDEIIGDIEARLGELISQGMGTRSIVMLPDAEAAVAVMGKPEDFGGDDPTSSNDAGSKKTGKGNSRRSERRLMRDEDDAVVAGVCSGLAAYFGFQDPVWMRLIFVLLFLASFGFPIITTYILIWILVPSAKTAADRLAMRGEPVNMDNIAREVEDSFERMGKRVNEFGAEAGKKSTAGAQSAMNTGMTAIGQAFGLMLRFIAKFAVLILTIIGIAMFLGIGAAWIGSIVTLSFGAPYVEYFSPLSSGWTWFAVVILFFLFGIPLIGLILFFSRILFKTRTPGWVKGILTGAFILSVVAAFAVLPFAAREYSHSGTVTKNVDLNGLYSDTLHVEAIPSPFDEGYFHDGFNFDEDHLRLVNGGMEMRCPLEIRVVESRDDRFRVTQIIRAQGSSNMQAQENADQVGYDIAFSGKTLRVPISYRIPQGKKWRVQRVRINIEVPEGKSITFDDRIHEYAGADLDEYDDDNNNNYISRRPGKVFRMGSDGLVCADCPNFGDKGYRSDDHYEDFILEGDFVAEIRKGNDFRIEIDGPGGEKDKIQKIRTGNKITLTSNGKVLNGSVRILIETPTFTSLHADNTGEITIRGFDEGRASIMASGKSKIKAYLDVSNDFSISLSGNASLDLTGEGHRLDASLSDNAILEAANWSAQDVEVVASDAARARVFAKGDALVLSTGQSSIKVDGGANVRNKREEN